MSLINTELALPERNDPSWRFVTNLTNLNYDIAEIAQTGKSEYFQETIEAVLDALKNMEKLEPNIGTLELSIQLTRLKEIYKSDVEPTEKFAKMNGILKNNVIVPIVRNREWIPVKKQDVDKLKDMFSKKEKLLLPDTLKIVPVRHKFTEEEAERIPMNKKEDIPSNWHKHRDDPEVAIEVMKRYAKQLDALIGQLDGYEDKTRQLINLTDIGTQTSLMADINERVTQLSSRMRTAQMLAVKVRNKIYRLEELPFKVKQVLISDKQTLDRLYTYFMTDPQQAKKRSLKFRDEDMRKKLTRDFSMFLQQWLVYYTDEAEQMGIDPEPALQLVRYGQEIKDFEFSYESLTKTLDKLIEFYEGADAVIDSIGMQEEQYSKVAQVEEIDKFDDKFWNIPDDDGDYGSHFAVELNIKKADVEKALREFYKLEIEYSLLKQRFQQESITGKQPSDTVNVRFLKTKNELESVSSGLIGNFANVFRLWHGEHDHSPHDFFQDVVEYGRDAMGSHLIPLTYFKTDIYQYFVDEINKSIRKKGKKDFDVEQKYDEQYIRKQLEFTGSEDLKEKLWLTKGYEIDLKQYGSQKVVENVEKALIRMQEAETVEEKIIALHYAITISHYSGQLAEYVGVSKALLDELSNMDVSNIIESVNRMGVKKNSRNLSNKVQAQAQESQLSPELQQRQESLITSPWSAVQTYSFAKDVKGADIPRLQETVIKLGDAKWMYYFALFIKGADVSRLQEAVIKIGNAGYMYEFAKDVEGADISKLQEVVIKIGGSRWIYHFARDVEGADIQRLQEAIIQTGDAVWIYEFARDIKGANIPSLQEAINESRDFGLIIVFAKDVEGVDIQRLQEAVIQTGNPRWIYEFVRDVKKVGVDIPKLQEAIIQTDDANYIYHFARDIEGADIPSLQEGMIKTGSTHYMYKFARNVEGVDVSRLQEALIQTGDVHQMQTFERYTPGANIEEIDEGVLNFNENDTLISYRKKIESTKILNDMLIASGKQPIETNLNSKSNKNKMFYKEKAKLIQSNFISEEDLTTLFGNNKRLKSFWMSRLNRNTNLHDIVVAFNNDKFKESLRENGQLVMNFLGSRFDYSEMKDLGVAVSNYLDYYKATGIKTPTIPELIKFVKSGVKPDTKNDQYSDYKNMMYKHSGTSKQEDIDNYVESLVNHKDFGKKVFKPESKIYTKDGKKYTVEILDGKDPLGLVLGEREFTGCCQKLEGVGEQAMTRAYVEPNHSFVVQYVEGQKLPVSQGIIVLQGDDLIFDSIEFADKVLSNTDVDNYEPYLWFLDRLGKKYDNNSIKKEVKKSNIKKNLEQVWKKFSKYLKTKYKAKNVVMGTQYSDFNMDKLKQTDIKFEGEGYSDARDITVKLARMINGKRVVETLKRLC